MHDVATNSGGLRQGYRLQGRGGLREPLWRQTASRKQLTATLKYILAEARERRWKYGRRDGDGGVRELAELESDAGINGPRYDGTETSDVQVVK